MDFQVWAVGFSAAVMKGIDISLYDQIILNVTKLYPRGKLSGMKYIATAIFGITCAIYGIEVPAWVSLAWLL